MNCSDIEKIYFLESEAHLTCGTPLMDRCPTLFSALQGLGSSMYRERGEFVNQKHIDVCFMSDIIGVYFTKK